MLITSTEEKAHMLVSASDHCERTILFPLSILAKDQINESMNSVSSAMLRAEEA